MCFDDRKGGKYLLKSFIRSKIFDEFTSEEKNLYFSLKEKAVSSHVDTLYYSIFLDEDINDCENERIGLLLSDLAHMKFEKQKNPGEEFKFNGLLVVPYGAPIGGGLYSLRLSCPEKYDIFVSSYLPNKDTPRIQVQLRTRALVLDGLYESIQASLKKVLEILFPYRLHVFFVQENRIDYAYHTNCIQNPMEMFGDESLNEHLVTSFREVWKHEWITAKKDSFLELDYIALGSRKSNNIYFRIYNKGKEVVQENYKGFFFKIWHERGLISAYDLYCYEEAYKMKSFKTGLLVGRIKWYLQYGKDAELKSFLKHLLKTCNIKSENNPRIEKAIKGILPTVTTVLNIEFETKRKLYLKLVGYFRLQKLKEKAPVFLDRLYLVLKCRKEVFNKLTCDVVKFVNDRKDEKSDYMDWWRRVRSCKICDAPPDASLKAWYSYSMELDIERSKRQAASKVATVSILSGNISEEIGFSDDLWEYITLLNDNDLTSDENFHKRIKELSCRSYRDIREKRLNKLKPLIKPKSDFKELTSDAEILSYYTDEELEEMSCETD